MADLFRHAAEAATAAAVAAAAMENPLSGEQQQQQQRLQVEQQGTRFASDDASYGGHNLRPAIRAPATGQARPRTTGGTARPLSSLTTGGGTRQVLNIPTDNLAQFPPEQHAENINITNDDVYSVNGSSDSDAADIADGNEDIEGIIEDQDGIIDDNIQDTTQNIGATTTHHTAPPPPIGTTEPTLPTATTTTPHSTPANNPQPFFYTHVSTSSGLNMAAARLATDHGLATGQTLHWQADIGGETTKIKAFRQDVLQQLDLVAFACMRPGSIYIQILHSAATFAVQGGDAEMKGKDYGFIGDRTDFIPRPSAVLIEDKVWKWVSKKVSLDITPLEYFYAVPGNARKFWHPPNREGEQDVAVPRILLLPPSVLAFCVTKPRTPFELHQFMTSYATSASSEITINECKLVLDWCIVAAHHDNSSSTSSSLAHVFPIAPMHDEVFVRWLNKVVDTTLGPVLPQPAPAQQPPPAQTAQPPQPPPHATQPLQPTHHTTTPPPVAQPQPTQHHAFQPPQAPATLPPPLMTAQPTQPSFTMPSGLPPAPTDIWAQIAANLTQGIANVAATLQPAQATSTSSTTAYEEGGRYYDDFQLAVLRGFSHTHDVTKIPAIWPLFQYTKHMDTHRDNIKRKMEDWALSITPTKRIQVQIERGLYLAKSTMQDILAMRFNPGGGTAELATVTQGLSILACRAVSLEDRQAIRRRELLEPRASRRTVSEMEHDLPSATDLNLYPDDFNELHRCVGTYCALLHTLFGERCAFYKHCYLIWNTMQSDLVYEHRNKFTALFCRNIIWAIVDDGRHYFSQRMTLDDFAGKYPEDVTYPRSNLIEIEPNVRRGIPIVRFSFPATWAATLERNPPSAQASRTQASIPPVVVSSGGTQPSVVSGVTMGSRNTRTPQPPRPRISIRAHDVHPTIKTTMEPYIAKLQSIRLNQMLSKLNLTVDDLPTLPAAVSGTPDICYNYVLGFCTLDSCRHQDGHVRAENITDEFATDLIARLRPAITDFMTNGLPPKPTRGRGRRRQRNE